MSRHLRKPLLVGTLPVLVAVGGWLTNVLTSGWDPWLFGGLVAIVAVTVVLTVAADRPATDPQLTVAPTPEPPPEPAPGPPAVWLDVPPRGLHFTGRGDLLAALDRQPIGSHTATVLVPHALHGLGGVGKTQLAIEYAHRHQSSFDLVAWIPAEQQALLRSSFQRIAAAMGIADPDSSDRTVARVRDGLRRGVPFRRWLIVFDNAESPAALRRYVPEAAPPASTGRVIITSRDRTWSSYAEAVEVEVLSRAESVALVHRRNPGVIERDALRLAEQLGDLPLALEQASAWLDASGTRVGDYLRILADRTTDLLGANQATDYPMSVAATWGVTLDRLSGTDPVAVRLLELAAFFGPEPVDRRLFAFGADDDLPPETRDLLADPLRLDQALASIGRLSLARFDAERGTVQLHRLVRTTVRARVGEERQELLRTSAQVLLAAADASVPDWADPATWPVHAMVTPHLRFTGCLAGPGHRIRQLVLHHLGYLEFRGDLHSSRQFAEEAWGLWTESLGPGHEDTLTVAVVLANAARSLGDTRYAKQLLEEILGRARRRLGNAHRTTLYAANSYGASLRIAGVYRGAYQIDLRTLEDSRRTFGPSSAETMRNVNNLVVNLRMLGRFAEALTRDRENLAREEELVGARGPDYVVIRLNCAIDLYHLGRYRDCLRMLDDDAAAAEAQIGPTHIFVLLTMRTQVAALTAQGDSEAAIPLARRALTRCRDDRGDHHPLTLAMAMTAANALRERHPAEALALSRDTLAAHREIDGDGHPATIAALINTAATERHTGDHRSAAAHDDEAVPAAARVLGADHWVSLCAVAGQGVDHHVAGDRPSAVRLLRQAHERAAAVQGPEHPFTLGYAVNLLHAAGRSADAGDLRALRAATRDRLTRTGDTLLLRKLRRREWAECPVELPPY
ncbi:FxSxx-COOH system tetratricopeptide repeat protein [Actinoplanes rectilineatus]|uniref:FxSxx-COOH system tetratricopeptide repeat protein n=1 Tax=Actinoplanes rectilineatus TaxID=113571 RepID=UPI0005F2C840|nr:FxSxx-COOH system tetratricopeptide repeat protein [Actinoplanes rectilineatus]